MKTPVVKKGYSAVLHCISRSAIMDAERLMVAQWLADDRQARIIQNSIIRKANRLLAVLTVLKGATP